MRAFFLAPDIAVSYWRTTPVGIMPARREFEADFAILGVLDIDDTLHQASTRFELPAEAGKLAAVVAAINVAYARGHLDRTNRMLDVLGIAVLDRMPAPAPAKGAAR